MINYGSSWVKRGGKLEGYDVLMILAGGFTILVRSKPVYVSICVVLEHLEKIQDTGMCWVLLATFRKA